MLPPPVSTVDDETPLLALAYVLAVEPLFADALAAAAAAEAAVDEAADRRLFSRIRIGWVDSLVDAEALNSDLGRP